MNKKTYFHRLKDFRLGLFALTFALFLLLPAGLPKKTEAVFCACCANEGEWFENKKALESFESYAINQAKISAKVQMYEGAADPQGIASTDGDFTLKLSRARSKWTMALQNKKGEKGNLTLSLPSTVTSYGVDPRDGRPGGGGGPLLYKELRLEGRVSGTGIFAKGIKPDTRFRLVLQGRGNMCLDSEDFNSWILQIYGKQTRYSFYGTFDKKATR